MWNGTPQHLTLENYDIGAQSSPNSSAPGVSGPHQNIPPITAAIDQTPTKQTQSHHQQDQPNHLGRAEDEQDKKIPPRVLQSNSTSETPPDVSADLPVPSSSDTANFFKQSSPSTAPAPPSATIDSQQRPQQPLAGQNDKNVALAQAAILFVNSPASPGVSGATNNHSAGQVTSPNKSPSGSSTHSQSAVHPMLKQQVPQTSYNHPSIKALQQGSHVGSVSSSTSNHFDSVKFKPRSGGRPKDPVWVYFHTNGNGTDERATCKYCGWHVERPKAFRMRDHIAQCAQVDPSTRADMTQLIAFKEAAAAAKHEEKASIACAANATSGVNTNAEALSSAAKKRKLESPILTKPLLAFGKSPITCHVLDATSGKPGDEMGIRLDRLTSNGFVLIANGTTDRDGRCNTLLPGGSRPEIGIFKVTFFSNEFYQKRGIVSFYPFVEVTFEVKDPTEHYHIPLLLSPYSFSTYRGS